MITEEERIIRKSQGYDIGFEQNNKKYWINSSTWAEEKNEKLFQETGLKAVREATGNKNLVLYNPEYFEPWIPTSSNDYIISYEGTSENKIPQPINMSSADSMFSSCHRLNSLDLNDWDMTNVLDMSNMFASCENLTELFIRDWDVSNVVKASHMFVDCVSLKSLDLSGWQTGVFHYIGFMFARCKNLEDLLLPNIQGKNNYLLNDTFDQCTALHEKYGTQDDVEIYNKIRTKYNETHLQDLQAF